jgi:hypothetical protein
MYAVWFSLLLFSAMSFAQQPAPGTEAALQQQLEKQRNQQSEMLRDPGMAFDKARQILMSDDTPLPNSSPPAKTSLTDKPGRISDPTLMTGSFTQALSRVSGKSGGPGGVGGGVTVPAFPNIYLAAKAIQQDENKSVMISVDGKTHLVKEGSKFSVMANNVLHEIQVNKITKDHVDITVMPMGRQMTLQ